MRDKKNIDRLFQEQFKDFEAQPQPEVWDRIVQTRKRKEEDRKIIPIWWKLGGVAAALALLISLGIYLTRTPGTESQIVNDTLTPEEDGLLAEPSSETKSFGIEEARQPVPSDNPNRSPRSLPNAEANSITQTEASYTKGSGQQSNPLKESLLDQEGGVAATTTQEEQTIASDRNVISEDGLSSPTAGTPNMEEGIAIHDEETKNPASKPAEEPVASTPEKTTEVTSPMSLEEAALAQKELQNKISTEEASSKKWSVGAAVAPVFYDSFEGSGVAQEFSDNLKAGDVNLSVGVQLSYAVSERLKVRSGVHKVDLSYRTGGVAFAPTLQGSEIKTINYAEDAQNIALGRAALLRPFGLNDAGNGLRPEARVAPKAGFLTQNLGYYEIPLELEYALVNKKLGVQLIGGLSTLMLSDNEIILSDGVSSTLIGSSNSLNDVSFTTNVGLGIDYELNKNLKLNLEPMFKYQLNAYTNEVSDFKPYFLGVYSGINFKF
ncbi:hypothetical protein [Croceiramulus getboli]|nr:hypothetical protein P8624_04275 [Flavobacteriaceae bacterium YJPT1-3]